MRGAFLALFAISIAAAAPTSDDAQQARIINYVNENDGKGNYEYRFETSNVLTRYETGVLVNAGQPDEHIAVQGEYSYIDPDGNLQTVRYIADQNGYRILLKPILKPPPELVPVGLSPAAVATLLG